MSLTDHLRFAYVCPLAWEKLMTQSATSRYCDACQLTVTDLSAMSKTEADTFLGSQTGSVCVRIARDAAGRSIHRRSALAGIATVAALSACMAPTIGDTGDTASDTSTDTGADTSTDTGGDTSTETDRDTSGDTPRSRVDRGAAGHRRALKGTALGVGRDGSDPTADGGDPTVDGTETTATGAEDDGATLEQGVNALLDALGPELGPEPEPQYITMGVMAVLPRPPGT